MKENENWWIIRTLRSQVMTDLAQYIPADYFYKLDERFRVDSAFNSAKHLESELQWGYKASVLGKDLFFNNSISMTARHKSASELMMHLGMLAASETAKLMTEEIAKKAVQNDVSDGNAGAVAKQLKSAHIQTFKKNYKGALSQYIKHLSSEERAPFMELLPGKKIQLIQELLIWLADKITVKIIFPLLAASVLLWFGLR